MQRNYSWHDTRAKCMVTSFSLLVEYRLLENNLNDISTFTSCTSAASPSKAGRDLCIPMQCACSQGKHLAVHRKRSGDITSLSEDDKLICDVLQKIVSHEVS